MGRSLSLLATRSFARCDDSGRGLVPAARVAQSVLAALVMSASFQLSHLFPPHISSRADTYLAADETAGLLDEDTFEMEDTQVIHESDEKYGKLDTSRSPDLVAEATDDVGAPSSEVTKKRQSLSDIFTIVCAGFALISDGYQNNLMTMTNVVLKTEYKAQYTSRWSTQVSNALLVGEIIGQITIGLTCDYLGRKFAIVTTTLMIVIGGILATASSGATIYGMFWCVARDKKPK